MIRRTLLALALVIPAAVGAQGAEKLNPDGERLCTADKGWCASIVEDKAAPGILIDDHGTRRKIDLPALPAEGGFEGTSYLIWPMRVPVGDKGAILVGSIMEERTMYSGGGAHASDLTLFLVAPSSPPVSVLTVPWDSGSMIRACFSEKDYRDRRGACHDEYQYSPEIEAKGADAAGYPVLEYRVKSTSYPGTVSRSADSLIKGRLRKKDLVHVEKADCSFTRTFRYDPQAKHYVPDAPLPECGNFTDL